MSAPARGRGYAMQATNRADSVRPLRRPGETGLKLRFGETYQNNNSEIKEDKVSKLCDKISEMTLTNPEKELQMIEGELNLLCDSYENMQKFVDKLISFAKQSKWNCHAVALLTQSYSNVTHKNEAGSDVTLRTIVLRKLYSFYKERNKAYLMLDKFLMDVTFICEIFHHVKLDGDISIQILANPIIDYLGMLIEGCTSKEIEVVYEQFPKCHFNLKLHSADELQKLFTKIRKQIVGESTSISVRARLLELLEMIVTDYRPLDENAKKLL